jgi:hypothetical protein
MVFLNYNLSLDDVCAINNALIDIINSRYVCLPYVQLVLTKRTDSMYYEKTERSWAVGSAVSRYYINADIVFRILPDALTMVASEALVNVFCQSPFALSRQDMETMSFFDAANNLTGRLCWRIIDNMEVPGCLPARTC